MQFTFRALEALKPDATGRTVEHFATGSEEKTPGLAIRVAPTGRRTFTFHFTFDGKRARMDLGTFPVFTLADARNAALAARRALDSDPPRDPREVRREERTADAAAGLTVSAVIDLYLADPDVSKLRTIEKVGVQLKSQVGRFIGGVTIAALTRRQLVECLDRIRQRGKATYAGQVHKNMRLCFDWAVGAGHMESNPMHGIPKPAGPEKTGAKIRPLNDEGELAAFWNGIRDVLPEYCRDVYSRILKLCLLTGCRVREIAEIKPGEIRDGVLTIPGDRTKNKKTHAVPLNAAMVALLGNDLDDPWGLVNGKPVTGHRVSECFSDRGICFKLGSVKGYNVHSLRRTFATGLDELGIPGSTISLCVNHSPKREERPDEGAAITRRYIVNSESAAQRKARARLELKRAAFDEWTQTVLGIADGSIKEPA